MPFNWKCPACASMHYYSGSQTTRATTNCPQTKKKIKIWQHKVVIEEPKVVVENNILDRPVRMVPVKRKRFHSKEYKRAQLRGVKVFLGLPDAHKKNTDIFDDARDIINGLEKFIERGKLELMK